MSDHIVIEEEGEPQLVQDGQEPEQPGSAALVGQLDAWTPEEASAFMASIFTTGILVAFCSRKARLPRAEEFEQLAAQPREFPGSGRALQPLLERFLPKSAGGGVAQIAAGVLTMAGEVGIAAGRRAPLLRPEKPARPGQAPAQGPSAGADAGAAPAAATEAEASEGVFRFSAEQAATLGRVPRVDDYSSMGMGSAA